MITDSNVPGMISIFLLLKSQNHVAVLTYPRGGMYERWVPTGQSDGAKLILRLDHSHSCLKIGK
jgi:hypothetical protein